MAKIAKAFLSGLAVFQGAGAFRVQQKRGNQQGEVALHDSAASAQEAGCGGALGELARQAVNRALQYALSGKSPLNVSLHAGQYDIPLWGCSIGLEMDASVLLSGFESAQIDSMECDSSTADTMTFSTRLSFGQRVETAGAVHSNWSVCGLDYPNETAVRMGVVTADPGLRVQVQLSKSSIPFVWYISEVKAFEIQVGELGGFTCGLSGVPDFIGSKFEQWCVGIVSWLAEKIADHLEGDAEIILYSTVGTELHETEGQVAKVEPPKAQDCGALGEIARRGVNSALSAALRGKSPLNVSLHAGQYDVSLWGCSIGLEMDASVMLSGFADAQLESMECDSSTADTMTFSSRLSFGRQIETAGAVHSNWSVCGLDYPNETAVRMGVVTADPGLRVSIKLSKSSIPFVWYISEIQAFEIQVGELDRFTCGLSGVPDFIGSRFEQWCVSIISWLAEKIADYLDSDTALIFQSMAGSQLEEPH